jgi:uncharacterized protein (TIRG00374 family)
VLLLVGTIVALCMLAGTKPETLLARVAMVGWGGFAAVLVQEIAAFLLNTVGWWLVFPPSQRPPLDVALLRIRIIGDAINYLTPSAGIGGEILRVDLTAPGTERAAATASVAVAKLTQALGHATYITAGLLFAAPALPRIGGATGVWMRLAFGLLWVGTLALLVLQRSLSIERTFARFLKKRRMRRFARDLDAGLAQIHEGTAAVIASIACFFIGWATGAFELWIVLHCLGLDVDLEMIVGVDAVMSLIEAVLFFMPSKLVAVEGGAAAACELMGLGAGTGLTFGVVRRLRQVFWAILGLALFALPGRGHDAKPVSPL